jgi:hypothetical protein
VNILYVVADGPMEWNSAEWRCAIPMREIAQMQGHGAAMLKIPEFVNSVNIGTGEMATVSMADLIFFQRNLYTPEAMRAAKYWQGAGRAVVLDLDDDYLGLPAGNPAYAFWYSNDGANIKALMANAMQVDLLTSPNKKILEKWRKVGMTRTLWLPNYPQGKWYEGLVKQPHDGFWVGWGGSASHYDTWFRSGCAEGIKLAFEKLPDAKLIIWGTDKRVLDMVDIPAEQKQYMGYIVPKDIYQWPIALAQFDVSLAPLGGEYDQHRSWIHVLEAMLAKVPFICSQGVPYAELGKWGREVPDSAESWAQAIIDARDNYQAWQDKAKSAYKQSIQLTIEAKAKDYVAEMNKVSQLRRVQLGARIPGVTWVTA